MEKRELSHQDAMVFDAWPLPLLTRLTAGSQGREARGRLHFPWAEPASETSQSVAWLRHWSWKGSGCLQSTKAFPTPQWVPDLPGQREWRRALGPSDRWLAAGPHPSDTAPSHLGRCASAGVNDRLEVTTLKKLQRKSEAFQGSKSEPLCVLLNPFQAWPLLSICSPALPRMCGADPADAQAWWTQARDADE